ncbi:c-type cytochrome [Uliginosibacterium gangwonense]|uniref:c-type cytochrome n=1 Tax=Uliginosibacterium gangwonense TaxID=392736 RepID=UPI00036DF6A2|nr:cytochrome c [Uliginosibacterium gangwonense]
MKAYRIAALAVAASLMSALAYAQAKPEQQIEYRQSAMTVTARSVGVLSAMAKGDIPFNKDVAQQHAALIASISDLPLTAGAFGPGTDKGAPTKADPKVWSEADKFKAGYDKFIQAAKAMPAAAVDQKSLQAALGNLGKTCKGCHDDYRQK